MKEIEIFLIFREEVAKLIEFRKIRIQIAFSSVMLFFIIEYEIYDILEDTSNQ